MPRPRRRPLPRGVYERKLVGGVQYWINFTDQHGQRRQELGGTTVEAATRALKTRREEVRAGTYSPGPGASAGTLRAFAPRFLEHRERRGVRTHDDDRARLEEHILPRLGDRRLEELTGLDVERFVLALRDAGTISGKTILNVHSTLAALLERARWERLVPENVARDLPPGTLPSAEPSRDVVPFTRDEAQLLVFDQRIPEPRRVLYAIAAFTGARLMEIAGLRWRDIDTDTAPLWCWALRTQADGKKLKTERDGTRAPRDVPIHPELRAVLETWKREGWARWVRRNPTPDDFVVTDESGGMLTKNAGGAKAVHRHAKLVGVVTKGELADGRHWSKDFHSFRRFFITTAQVDGAREEIVQRITHDGSPRARIMQRYTRFPFEVLCEAVTCLKLRPLSAEVVALGRVTDGVTEKAKGPETDVVPSPSEWRRRESKKARETDTTGFRGSPRPLRAVASGGNPAESAPVPSNVTAVTSLIDSLDSDERAALLRELLRRRD